MLALDLTGLDTTGYVVVGGVLESDVITRLRRAFDHAVVDSGTQHVEVTPDIPEVDAWSELCDHPLAIAAAEELLDHRTPFVAHGRNPLPGFGQQGLHADSRPRRPGEPVLALTAIWMLDAFTADNGATRVVPGSHVLRTAVPRAYAQPLAHHPDEIVVTGESGSVLIFNGHLWHSGTKNRSAQPRRAIQMTAHVERLGQPRT